MIALIYFLLISDMYGRTSGYTQYRYNFVPFTEILRFMRASTNPASSLSLLDVGLNLVGNVLAFAPFGALIRWVRNKKTKFWTATAYTFFFSLCIETLQLVTKVGVFDIDDIILNTMGGMLGYFCYYVLASIDRRKRKNAHK